MRKLSLSLSLLVLLLVTQTSVRAQCPTTTPPWTDGGCDTVTLSTGCQVEVCYCWRDIFGTLSYLVKSVQPLSLSCSTYGWFNLISDANEQLGNTLLAKHGYLNNIPPCTEGSIPIEESILVSCWEAVNDNPDPNGPPILVCKICPGAVGQCSRHYSGCLDAQGHLVRTFLNSSGVDGECEAYPDGNPPLGVCFNLDFCGE